MQRVLFVGIKTGTLNEVKKPQGLVIEGLVSFKDEIRDGVSLAIKEAKELGVNPIMITGDFKETAFKIAKEVGITTNINEVLSHDDIQKWMMIHWLKQLINIAYMQGYCRSIS